MSSNQQQRWAALVLAAFEDADLTTNQEIADADGPSTSTVSSYRKLARGEIDSISEPRADVFRKIDRVVGWEPGSARRLWRKGAEPRRRFSEDTLLLEAFLLVTHDLPVPSDSPYAEVAPAEIKRLGLMRALGVDAKSARRVREALAVDAAERSALEVESTRNDQDSGNPGRAVTESPAN